jgi:hypothetical protein
MAIFTIDDELKAKIATTKFVYLVARSGTGKSFSGDYLEAIRGWNHVDGDEPLKMRATDPAYEDAAAKLFGGGIYDDEMNADLEAWHTNLENHKPYFSAVANLTLQAAKDSDTVVISHATYLAQDRAFLRQCLVEAGAQDIMTLFLFTDPDVHAEALWNRTLRQAEQAGIPMKDALAWQLAGHIEDLESFKVFFREESWMYALFEEAEESEQPYKIVNNTARDETVLDSLDEACGIDKNLSRGDGTYEEMIEKIKAKDTARDQASFDADQKKLEEKELTKEEPEKVKARLSILLDAQKLQSVRRLSVKGKRASLVTENSRASFIKLGKIDFDEE